MSKIPGVKLPKVKLKKSCKGACYKQPRPKGEKETGGLNVDIGSKNMLDVNTYLNSLQIKRLSDRYHFEYSNSCKLSKTDITKAEAKKKANRGIDDSMASRLKSVFMED